MVKLRTWLVAVAVWPVCALAQFGSFGDAPVEITADGNTRFEGGVAVAEDNVQIHYGDYSIYCDYAEYNPDTRDVLLVGNIRLYTPNEVLTGQRALFNLETKQMRALEFNGARAPLFFNAFSFQAASAREFRVKDATATTDDSSMPDFRVKSRSIRIYTDDRVVLVNSTLYVGEVPIFWFPYLWANVNNTGFEFLPGFDSRWGPYLLTAYGFPIGSGDDITAKVRSDYRGEFGPAFGLDLNFKYGKNDRSFGTFIGYYAFDDKPPSPVGGPGEPEEEDDVDGRYRVTFKHRLFLTDDIYATADLNLLSDVDFLEDYYPNEFRVDPQPDNYLSLTKWDDFYTLTLMGRWQVNNFFEVTERLPELAFDFKQHRLFGLPIYYDGETGVAQLRRMFSDVQSFGEVGLEDYQAFRFDTYHQLSVPTQLFGWLNITPRAGFRATYYSESGTFFSNEASPVQEVDPDSGELVTIYNRTGPSPLNAPTFDLETSGPVLRPVVNFGVEVSTKLSKAYEKVQLRALGLDGLRHVIQPYMNFSYVYNFGPGPDEIYQFDRVVPATQLLPINFPQFTATDAIDTWAILRMGVRNRLQTRRDNRTFQWFELDTFMDANFENPYTDNEVSNLFNVMRFRPVPWFFVDLDSQLPLDQGGFTEAGVGFNYMPTDWLSFRIGNRYIDGNEFFSDNSQVDFSAYWRINEHWAVSFYEQYEFVSNVWQYQRYMIHRDLSSWVASLGAQVRDNEGGDNDLGVLFVLTLKDAPQVTLPIQFDQATSPIEPGASGD